MTGSAFNARAMPSSNFDFAFRLFSLETLDQQRGIVAAQRQPMALPEQIAVQDLH
jgi:hypothetical protein